MNFLKRELKYLQNLFINLYAIYLFLPLAPYIRGCQNIDTSPNHLHHNQTRLSFYYILNKLKYVYLYKLSQTTSFN